MAEKKFAIRFAVEDMEKVRTALKGMGDDGASALRAIERQSRQATPAMKAVDTAVKDIRGEFDALAGRVPIFGGALQALGPVGTAVAAGLAGVGLGVAAISTASRRAINDIGALKDASDNLNIGVEDLQALRGVGLMEGIAGEDIDSMLGTLAINSARASEGFGKMYAALMKVNPELAQQLAMSATQADRLDILAKAVQGASSYNDKLNISVAAFGSEGRQMIRVLEESGASMDEWRKRASAAGLVIDEELVNSVDALGDRLALLEARTAVAAQRLAVAAAPLVEGAEKLQADTMTGFALIIENMKPIEERSSYALRVLGNQIQRTMETQGDRLDIRKNQLQQIMDELDRRTARGDAAYRDQQTQQELGARESLWDSQGALDASASEERARARVKAREAEAEAERKAAEAVRLRTAQEREAIDIRASLGDWSGKLAQEEERLNALVAAGELSREHANAKLAQTRGELDGSTAAMARWNGILESAETPLQKAQRALAEFNAEVAKMGGAGDVNAFAVRWQLAEDIEAARVAAEEATPTFQAVKAARDAITRANFDGLSTEEKLALKQAELTALVGEYGFGVEDATAALHAYRAELAGMTNEQKENAFELRLSAEILGSILDENMNSLEDLGKTALRVFRQMAIEWIMANQKMAASKTFTDFITSAFTAPFGGGGGAPAPIPGADGNGNVRVPVNHTGAVIGSTPAPMRSVNPILFAGAPRMHGGGELRAGERAIIAEDGERMFSRVDNARIVRAIEAGGAGATPNVELHFHGMEGKPEVKQSRGPNDTLRIDVFTREAVAKAAGAGALDGVMQQRYGVGRAVAGGV